MATETQRRIEDVVEIKRHDGALMVPDSLNWDGVITIARREKQREDEWVPLMEVIECFPWEGARALVHVLREKFGFAQNPPASWFQAPPQYIMIDVGYSVQEEIIWGDFVLPGSNYKISCGVEHRENQMFFRMSTQVQRKDAPMFREIVAAVREWVKTNRIYQGKAFQVKFEKTHDDILMPEFLDVQDASLNDVIFSESVQNDINTNVLAHVLYPDAIVDANIPKKRGVVLAGTFGVGKSLLARVIAGLATQSGRWTYIYLDDVDYLTETINFAEQFETPDIGVIIMCEDIDRRLGGERDSDMDEVLNTLDGIKTKKRNLMVLFTTNDVEAINKAALRPGRIDMVINITPPDALATEALIRKYAGNNLVEGTDLTSASKRLAGQIPAFVREAADKAKLAAIFRTGGISSRVTGEDIVKAADSMIRHIQLLEKEEPKVLSAVEVFGKALEKGLTRAAELYLKHGDLPSLGLALEHQTNSGGNGQALLPPATR